jgi:SAM-dependent methyltransferase
MSHLTAMNPTGRFTGLAGDYARFRPSYPNAAVEHVLARCGLGKESLLVDVGAGTGISSRLFASRGLRVIGIDPNADMRAQAAAEPALPASVAPEYRAGRAEDTGLPSGSVDAVLAAQAFHWFAADAALREFHRILKPAGWVILLSYERDEADPFMAAFGNVFRSLPGTAAVEDPRAQAGQALLDSLLFDAAERAVFRSAQDVDEEELVGRAFSASYAPHEPGPAATFAAALHDLFIRWQAAGKVVLRYETAAYTAQRRTETGSQRPAHCSLSGA